jgi:hypothetical protein
MNFDSFFNPDKPTTDAQPKFNLTDETEKIAGLARDRLDTANTWYNNLSSAGAEAAQKLAQEWNSLTPDQRGQVTSELIKQYQNAEPKSTPSPRVLVNELGQMTGIEFTKSSLDLAPFGPNSIKLLSDGRNIMVSRENEKAQGGETIDFVANDVFGTSGSRRNASPKDSA